MELTHWDAEQADGDLDAREDVERAADAIADDPLKGVPGEGEAEHVLEDQEAGEGFDGDIAFQSRIANLVQA